MCTIHHCQSSHLQVLEILAKNGTRFITLRSAQGTVAGSLHIAAEQLCSPPQMSRPWCTTHLSALAHSRLCSRLHLTTPHSVMQMISSQQAQQTAVAVFKRMTRLAHLLLLKSQATLLHCCRCAGYDKVDLVAAARLGVAVTRVPSYSPASVAEHAVGMMLCLNRWGLPARALCCCFERGALPGQVGGLLQHT